MDNLTQNIFQSWLVSTTFQIIVLSALAYIAYHSFKKSRNSKYKIADSKVMAFAHFSIAALFALVLNLPPFYQPLVIYLYDIINTTVHACSTYSLCTESWIIIGNWIQALFIPFTFSISLILTSIVYLFEKNILKYFKKNQKLWNYLFAFSSALFIILISLYFIYSTSNFVF